MTAWAVVAAVAGLLAFGAVLYRAGCKSAQNTQFKEEQKANEKVDTIIRANAGLSRSELLTRLRDNKDK